MLLALRIENGEIGGSPHRHRLGLLAGRAAIGLHRVLVSLPERGQQFAGAGTATASPSGGLLAQCRLRHGPAGGTPLTAMFLLKETPRVNCFWYPHARARRDRAAAIFFLAIPWWRRARRWWLTAPVIAVGAD